MSKIWTAYDVIEKMTSSSQNKFFQKILVNTNAHVKFGVPMIFGLEVTVDGGYFCPPCKMRWSNSPCKVGLALFRMK